jgi:hypothetical protein
MNKTKTPTLPRSDIFFASLVAYLPAENFAVSVQHLFSRKEPAHRMKSITIATTVTNPSQINILGEHVYVPSFASPRLQNPR